MALSRNILTLFTAFLIAVPMCCCGVTLSDSTNYEQSSCCSTGGSSEDQSPCQDGECSCLEASDQIINSFELNFPSVSELKLVDAARLSDHLEAPWSLDQLGFYGVHRPPPPEPSFTKLYSVYQL